MPSRSPILISACLLGVPVCYDGGSRPITDPTLTLWAQEGRLVALCPEVDGGLTTPRPAAEIVDGDGAGVLDARSRIVTREGADVTDAFLRGAAVAVDAARVSGARVAILKARSPSCGPHRIHDGTFSGRTKSGRGVTAEALTRHGLTVFSDEELERARALVSSLD